MLLLACVTLPVPSWSKNLQGVLSVHSQGRALHILTCWTLRMYVLLLEGNQVPHTATCTGSVATTALPEVHTNE